MKKFSLLALVAVMVMAFAGAAFAAANPSTLVGDPKAHDGNVGAIAAGKAATGRLYYINNGKAGDLDIVVSIDVKGNTGSDAVSFDAEPISGDNKNVPLTTSSTGTSETSDGYVDATLTYTGVSLDKVPGTIAITNIGTAGAADKITGGASLTLTTVDVKNALTVDTIPTFYTSADAVAKFAVEIDQPTGYYITGISADPAANAATISWDVVAAGPAGITVVISSDAQLAVSAAESIDAAPGTYTGYIVAATDGGNVVVSDDKYDDIAIAGLGTKDILATFTVKVEKNPASEVIEALNADADAKKEAVDLLKAGDDKAVVLVRSADGTIAGVNDTSLVKPLSGDTEVLRLEVALLSVDQAGNLIPDPAFKDLTAVNVVISSDSDNKNYTASFDVRPNATSIPVNQYVARFQVKNGSARNGFYTLFVKEGARDSSITEVSAKATGDTITKLGLEVDNGRHPGSGSSSSCDMGFGLAALAGLAVLALRKRSK